MKSMKRAILFALAGLLAPTLLLAAEKKPLPKDLPPFGEDKPLPKPAIAQSEPAERPHRLDREPRPGVPARRGRARRTRRAPPPTRREWRGSRSSSPTRSRRARPPARSRRIAEELQAVGGEISAYAADDAIYLTVNGARLGCVDRSSTCWPTWPGTPSFPAAEVELAKGNALQGLAGPRVHPGVPGPEGLREGGLRRPPVPRRGPVEGDARGGDARGAPRRSSRAASGPRAPSSWWSGDVDAAAVSGAVTRFVRSLEGDGRGARSHALQHRAARRATAPGRRPAGLGPVADHGRPARRRR